MHEFSSYAGSQVSEALAAAQKRTWDPIVAAVKRCDCMALYRFGPLPTSRKSERAKSYSGRALRPAASLASHMASGSKISALREDAWHSGDCCRWGSAYGFTQKLTRSTRRIKSDCCAPAPPAAPLPGLPHTNPQTKAAIHVCVAKWRAYLLALGRALRSTLCRTPTASITRLWPLHKVQLGFSPPVLN
jgi:hypothetical protein